jgi:MoxR-like ATPase
LESKLAELGCTEDPSNDDSIVWAEELFEDRVVEQPENQAEDQAPMPTAPVFPSNEVDRKGKRQMTDLELWRFEDRVDPQTMGQEQLDSALDWMNLADHFAIALAFENQVLANKMDEL